jgi:hypothetical protein
MTKGRAVIFLGAVIVLIGFAVYFLIDAGRMTEITQPGGTYKTSTAKRTETRTAAKPEVIKASEKVVPSPRKDVRKAGAETDKTAKKKVFSHIGKEQLEMKPAGVHAKLTDEYIKERQRQNYQTRTNGRTERIVASIGPQCGISKDRIDEIAVLMKERNERIFELYDTVEDIGERRKAIKEIKDEYRQTLEGMLDEKEFKKFDKMFSHRDPIRDKPHYRRRSLRSPKMPGSLKKR